MGSAFPPGNLQVVILVASGFGIAAHLPYLRQLIYRYNSRKVRTRRIHLVWQLETPGMSSERVFTSPLSLKKYMLTYSETAMAVESLLNKALVDDTLDDGYVWKPHQR